MTPSEIHADERLVHVPLGERAYDILIGPGLIGRAGGEISRRSTSKA
jgi:3-dehydroquinate synthase